jgi:hypothetical protein
MDCNEKAPLEAATSEQDAQELVQPQNTPDFGNCQEPVDPVIPELIAINRRLKELFESHDILSAGTCGEAKVQLYGKSASFFNLFSIGEYEEVFTSTNGFIQKQDRYSTTVQGVEFFCLVEKESEKCTAQ